MIFLHPIGPPEASRPGHSSAHGAGMTSVLYFHSSNFFALIKKATLFPENGYVYFVELYHPQAVPGPSTRTTTRRRICRMLSNIVLKHGSNIEIKSIPKYIRGEK
jgi:hypothetical protein